jgi:hypothetical protein
MKPTIQALSAAKLHFENHPNAKEIWATSDGHLYLTEKAAKAHYRTHTLKASSVNFITRAEALAFDIPAAPEEKPAKAPGQKAKDQPSEPTIE